VSCNKWSASGIRFVAAPCKRIVSDDDDNNELTVAIASYPFDHASGDWPVVDFLIVYIT